MEAAGGEEALDGDAAVNVGVLEAARGELLYDFGWFARHLLHGACHRREIERAPAEHDGRLLAVKFQVAEFAHHVEGAAAHHDDVHSGEEFRKAVRDVAAGVKEVEGVVGAREEAVNADAAEDGEFDDQPPTPRGRSVVVEGGFGKERGAIGRAVGYSAPSLPSPD